MLLERTFLLVACVLHSIQAESRRRDFSTAVNWRARGGGEDSSGDEPPATSRLFFPGAGQMMAGMGQAVQPLLLMIGLHSALMMFPQMIQKAIAPKLDAFHSWRRHSDRMSPRLRNTWKLFNRGVERYAGHYHGQLARRYQEPLFVPRY